MAGRFAYFVIGGAAVLGGIILQDDLTFGSPRDDVEIARALIGGDEDEIDRTIARVVDRDPKAATRDEGRQAVGSDEATERALTAAVAELVRAEGSLITAKLDDDTPTATIRQAEERRDSARQAVERLSHEAKAESAGNRDALRRDIDEAVRDAVRG